MRYGYRHLVSEGLSDLRLHDIERTGPLRALLEHPSLAALLGMVQITFGNVDTRLHPAGIAVGPIPGSIVVSEALGSRPGSLLVLRFGLEYAALVVAAGLGAAPTALLAARAAGAVVSVLPSAERISQLADPVAIVLHDISNAGTGDTALIDGWHQLQRAVGDCVGEIPTAADLAMVRKLWPMALPVESLLVAGGDDRLLLNETAGQNRYGCLPWPRPDAIEFSSCTASSISGPGFASAEQTRQSWLGAGSLTPTDKVLRNAAETIRRGILSYFCVEDIADAIITASGTDASLILTGLISSERPGRRVNSVLVNPGETGSGVPDAVRGRHFASCTASGWTVEKGKVVAGFEPISGLVSVALRTDAGWVRPMSEISADFTAAIAALASSGHTVLHAIDGSKTGFAAPDLATCRRLGDIYGDRVDIVIDACQARTEPEQIRWYLLQGWPVLVTGSKFFGAPGFCGAILFPRDRLRRIEASGPLPDGLFAYSPGIDGAQSSRWAGVLLRWMVGLQEMQRFAKLPWAFVRNRLKELRSATHNCLAQNAHLRFVGSPRPARLGWSDLGSVLSFMVVSEDAVLSIPELQRIYRGLNTGSRPCLIGQPVKLGDGSVGALRIAFSAAQIADAADLMPELMIVFERLRAEIAR